jgi:hypothetical protein
MKFIHAIIFDVNEYNELKEYGVDFENWDDIADGDYIVHCLYDVDNEHIIIHEDNTHAPVETIIETFLEGVRYRDAVNVGGLMVDNSDVEVINAYIVVDNGLSYDKEAATLCLVEGAYVEVED